jgi:hypothetical protein
MKRTRFVLLAGLLLASSIASAQPAPGAVWEFKVDESRTPPWTSRRRGLSSSRA